MKLELLKARNILPEACGGEACDVETQTLGLLSLQIHLQTLFAMYKARVHSWEIAVPLPKEIDSVRNIQCRLQNSGKTPIALAICGKKIVELRVSTQSGENAGCLWIPTTSLRWCVGEVEQLQLWSTKNFRLYYPPFQTCSIQSTLHLAVAHLSMGVDA